MRILVLLLLLSLPAQGGPWPRAQGQAYVFIGHEDGMDGWTSLYAEYGGPRNLTFGLDLGGHGMRALKTLPDPVDGRLRAFVRAPLLSGTQIREGRPRWLTPWLLAVEVGVGLDLADTGDTTPTWSLGTSVGRGFQTRWGDGWTTVDLRLTEGGLKGRRINGQAVMGIKPTDRLTLEMGLFAEQEQTLSLTLAPTLQYEIGDYGGLRLGLSVTRDGDRIGRIGWARDF
ncbi:hypothetical protein [Jannaschia sp. M317]|uniref:hypothetical protein n=1 Tax=Jannaschia sp. M317 TaxID=2867011 RepID=UPI0021A57970|nr:hypothetical protein [Jannaschia sp. M317]UWQ18454.1 hypothetical protein K3551_03890 [Jannaschia sp. M317]